jgi:hypothetical protein
LACGGGGCGVVVKLDTTGKDTVLLAIFLLVAAASAQEKLAIADHVPAAPSTHNFWNTENKIDFSIFAGQIAADAITTQRDQRCLTTKKTTEVEVCQHHLFLPGNG